MDFGIESKVNGKDSSPGLGRLWYGELGEFATLSTVPSAPATQEEKVSIEAAHVFSDPVTQGFRLMYTTDTMRNLETERTGGRDSKGNKVTVNAFFPGTSKEFEAFRLDDPLLICIAEPFPCDGSTKIQIGTACSPARIVEDSWNSATVGEGEKGYTFKIEAYQSSLLFYDHDIPQPTG